MSGTRRRLLRWLLVATILEAALLAAVVMVPPRLFRTRPDRDFGRMLQPIIAEMPLAPEDPGPSLDRASRLLRTKIELVRDDGTRRTFVPEGVRFALKPRFPPLRADVPPAKGGGRLEMTFASPPEHQHSPWPSIVSTIGVLVIVFGFTVLLARRMLEPVEALSGAMDRFGRGELSARAGLTRDDELGELGRRFDEMAARIGMLVRTKDELLGSVAHELRTPLSRLHVALDLLTEAKSSDSALIADTARDLAELEQVVDDVLLLARAQVGADLGRFPREKTDLVALVADLCEQRRVAGDPITCVLPSQPVSVAVPPRLFRRAVQNLLVNACTHGASPKPVEVTLAETDGAVELRIRDHGRGMTSDEAAKAFEPFFRADESRTRETGGVGLGLSLARRFVETSGGIVALTSSPGEGTEVRVTFARS